MLKKLIRAFTLVTTLVAALLAATVASAQTSGADTLAAQRALFLQTRAQLQIGNTESALANSNALRQYPLSIRKNSSIYCK